MQKQIINMPVRVRTENRPAMRKRRRAKVYPQDVCFVVGAMTVIFGTPISAGAVDAYGLLVGGAVMAGTLAVGLLLVAIGRWGR